MFSPSHMIGTSHVYGVVFSDIYHSGISTIPIHGLTDIRTHTVVGKVDYPHSVSVVERNAPILFNLNELERRGTI